MLPGKGGRSFKPSSTTCTGHAAIHDIYIATSHKLHGLHIAVIAGCGQTRRSILA